MLIKDPIDLARVTYNPGTLYAGEDVDCGTSTPPTLNAKYKLVGDETTTTATATTGGATGDYGVTTPPNVVTTNVGTIAGAAQKTTIFDVTINSN